LRHVLHLWASVAAPKQNNATLRRNFTEAAPHRHYEAMFTQMLLLVRYETTNSIMHTQNSLYRKVNDSRVLFSEKQVFGETLDVENEIRWKTSEFEPFHCRITFSFIFLSQRKMISGFNSFLCSNTTK